ncbi:MAG: hypothetical protein IPQ16_06615 [Geobacteraceae bacterium]|nr:hypothetical protein [Geobacteraceae bacterium]
MRSLKNTNKKRCPLCGGHGVISNNMDKDKDIKSTKKAIAKILDEQRLPNLTGIDVEVEEALKIRSRFILKASRQYQPEHLRTFMRLISYEAHAAFWIYNKNSELSGLVAHIAAKNPSAFVLTNKML